MLGSMFASNQITPHYPQKTTPLQVKLWRRGLINTMKETPKWLFWQISTFFEMQNTKKLQKKMFKYIFPLKKLTKIQKANGKLEWKMVWKFVKKSFSVSLKKICWNIKNFLKLVRHLNNNDLIWLKCVFKWW